MSGATIWPRMRESNSSALSGVVWACLCRRHDWARSCLEMRFRAELVADNEMAEGVIRDVIDVFIAYWCARLPSPGARRRLETRNRLPGSGIRLMCCSRARRSAGSIASDVTRRLSGRNPEPDGRPAAGNDLEAESGQHSLMRPSHDLLGSRSRRLACVNGSAVSPRIGPSPGRDTEPLDESVFDRRDKRYLSPGIFYGLAWN